MAQPYLRMLLQGFAGALLALAPIASQVRAQEALPSGPRSFSADQGKFILDGKPFQIISGEMHYTRVPRAYWRARLKMAKAMGLNAITTYVFWNAHETRPGTYDFSGQNDVAEFIREAQQEGLYVILRPGPYACAEWEWGGYPWWLLKDHGIVVRSSDPKFMQPATAWLQRLGRELAPLQIGNGGPIIAVQVENEYGSFDDDHAYMEQIHHALENSGFTKALLYTADGPQQLPNGALPELPAVINFGIGDAEDSFRQLRMLRSAGPFMTGEYWDGWFDHWGEKHHVTDADKAATELDWMLKQGYSISLYMFHGGTSFGWMNGANYTKQEGYQPDVTSYDYNSPLSESGQPAPSYYKFRDVISRVTGKTPPPVPSAPAVQSVTRFMLPQSTSLWNNLPAPLASHDLQSMEDLDQAYGYMLYRTTIPADTQGDLVLDGLHDYAQIYAGTQLVGTLDRRLKQDRLPVSLTKGTSLNILVENSGRVNFTKVMRGERKGIVGSVTLDGRELHDWQIYSLPMLDPQHMHYAQAACSGPCFYQASFEVSGVADTFLDTSSFTKGFVWVNGHPLGRIWNIGPQKTLFLPGPWLKQGRNDVVVFDLHGVNDPALRGLEQSLLDGYASSAAAQ